jgi:hypothetical protein
MKKYIRCGGHYNLNKGIIHRFWKKPFYNIPSQILNFISIKQPTPTPTPTVPVSTPTPTPTPT